MALTTVLLGTDKAGDLTRALALMVAQGSVSVARVYHDTGCPAAEGNTTITGCTCNEVDVEVQPIEMTP